MNKEVSFLIAEKLNGKAFDEDCKKGWYLPHPNIAIQNKIQPNTWQLVPLHPLLNQIKAPTIADVVMWLYEKHDI